MKMRMFQNQPMWQLVTNLVGSPACRGELEELSFPSFPRWGDGWRGGATSTLDEEATSGHIDDAQEEVKTRVVQSKRRSTLA